MLAPPRPIFAPPCIVVPSATRLSSTLRLDSTVAHRSQTRRELVEVQPLAGKTVRRGVLDRQ